MALVYDIVRTVTPAAARQTSYSAGEHCDDFRNSHAAALEACDTFNRHAWDGVSYSVREIDEESPDRAAYWQ